MSKPKKPSPARAQGAEEGAEPARGEPGQGAGPILYTVGHSNRGLEEFLAILLKHRIVQLVDIRTLPGSRSYPHFDKDRLCESLADAGIAYLHVPELGGRRRPRPDSVNTGWRHPAFRGYADYMQTDVFRAAVERLAELARERPAAIMCSEAVPWRCHRSLVADAMQVRGFEVIDLISRTSVRPHKLTGWARVHGLNVEYPAQEEAAPDAPR
ncbi:MAG: DUF488 domain-containing protein [Polyangia bacterium]